MKQNRLSHSKTAPRIQNAAHAIDRAIDFLALSLNSEGLWSDFLLLGGSDEYVTAYIGAILSGSSNYSAQMLSREAWKAFGRRNFFTRHGGWGYNAHLPEDADSTAWGIKFATNLGLKDSVRCKIAEKFLRLHITTDGGIASYTVETAFKALVARQPGNELSGWLNAHPCVTAAAAVIPSFNHELIPYLLQQQLPDGGWGAYWTSDTVFTTSFAIEALLMDNYRQHQQAIEKGLNRIIEQFSGKAYISNELFPSGSPWATALSVRALAMGGWKEECRLKLPEAVEWLLEQQKPDGSWESSTTMLMPPPTVVNTCNSGDFPDEQTRELVPLYPDHLALYTTSTVIDALGFFIRK